MEALPHKRFRDQPWTVPLIHLLLAGESRLTCDAFGALLQHESDFYLIGSAYTLDQLQHLLPSCTLLLITSSLEDSSIAETIAAARDTQPDVKIVVSGIEQKPEQILLYVEAGADGYILQNESVDKLLQKTRAAVNDRAIVSPEVAARLFDRVAELADHALSATRLTEKTDGIEALTPRELDVLQLIQRGHTNRQIAEELFISVGTAKNHVHNILRKLDVSNRNAAAAIYEVYQTRLEIA